MAETAALTVWNQHLNRVRFVATNSTAGRGAICLFADLTNVVELEEQLRLKEALAE